MIAALGFLLTVAAPLQGIQGTRYTFRMTFDRDEPIVGTVREDRHRSRIDLKKHGAEENSYLVITHDGHRVIAVRPADGEYSVLDDSAFERIVGTALQAVSSVGIVRFRVYDARISTERLGAGDSVAGLPTRHYRLTQDFTVDVSAFGAHGDPIRQHLVTDFWVSPDSRILPNPLIEMLTRLGSALGQSDPEFVRRSAAARDSLFSGTPLRVVVTATSDAKDDAGKPPSLHRLEITAIERGTFNPGIWEVPAGLHRKEGAVSWSF